MGRAACAACSWQEPATHGQRGKTARRQLVDAEAARLASLGATLVRARQTPGQDHYGVAMADPEGNEFDIN